MAVFTFFPTRTLLFAEELRVEVGALSSPRILPSLKLSGSEGWCFVYNVLRQGIIHIELWFISKSQRVVASSWHAAAEGKLLQSNEVSDSALCSDRQTVAPFKVEGKEQSTLRQRCSCYKGCSLPLVIVGKQRTRPAFSHTEFHTMQEEKNYMHEINQVSKGFNQSS